MPLLSDVSGCESFPVPLTTVKEVHLMYRYWAGGDRNIVLENICIDVEIFL